MNSTLKTTRQKANQHRPLDGVEAGALEYALFLAETERDAAQQDLERQRQRSWELIQRFRTLHKQHHETEPGPPWNKLVTLVRLLEDQLPGEWKANHKTETRTDETHWFTYTLAAEKVPDPEDPRVVQHFNENDYRGGFWFVWRGRGQLIASLYEWRRVAQEGNTQ